MFNRRRRAMGLETRVVIHAAMPVKHGTGHLEIVHGVARDANLPPVQLFAHGSCSGSPGPGGWAFLLRHPRTGKELERSGAERDTTHNRMELTAAVKGLEALRRPCRVELLTDSVYVGKGLTEWLKKWKANGFRRREGQQLKPIKNEVLWRRLDELVSRHVVQYTRVVGNGAHPEIKRCDALAVAAYNKYLRG